MQKSCVVWMAPALADLVEARLPGVCRANTRRDFYRALAQPVTAVFVDGTTLPETGAVGTTIPIIGVLQDSLPGAIRWLDDYPWVGHILTESMLSEPRSEFHLSALVHSVGQIGNGPSPTVFLGTRVSGRMARLVDAGRRPIRLDRMGQFFESMSVGPRTVSVLRDVAEELLTNAFYNAPVAAGFFSRPVLRSEEVIVTADRGCDISYGSTSDGVAFVRVRDSFGSLTRRRLVEVLKRCARTGMDVPIDDSMGGAGLGLWRVFSAASFVALSVIPGQSTEFVVGVQKRKRTMSILPGAARPYSIHLYFEERAAETQAVSDRYRTPHDVEMEVSATFQLT